jgi:hypothetical protein
MQCRSPPPRWRPAGVRLPAEVLGAALASSRLQKGTPNLLRTRPGIAAGIQIQACIREGWGLGFRF